MEPSKECSPPDPSYPPTTPRRRPDHNSKPVPYRGQGGFKSKKPDSGPHKWVRVVPKEPEQKSSQKRIYSKEQICRVAQEEQSQDTSSLRVDIAKREIKNVRGNKSKHRPLVTLPKWCADVRKKTDPLTRNLKSLLNKLAPTNYPSILSKTQGLLTGEAALAVAVHVFDKASAESKYSELYARLCEDLIVTFPDFKSYLVTTYFLLRCQHAFETTAVDFDFQAVDPVEQQEKLIANRKKILGCVRFIGELATHKVISPMRLFECCRLLLHQHSHRSATGVWSHINEDCIEGLCYLISSCPRVNSSVKFAGTLQSLLNDLKDVWSAEILSPRVGFLVQDILDGGILKQLCRERAEGPLPLEELHRRSG